MSPAPLSILSGLITTVNGAFSKHATSAYSKNLPLTTQSFLLPYQLDI